MSHVKLTVTIEEELYNKIENQRKFESRSSFVNRKLKKEIGVNRPKSNPNFLNRSARPNNES